MTPKRCLISKAQTVYNFTLARIFLMDVRLFPKQAKAWQYLNDDKVTELLYGGGARGGKSAFGCIWQIIRRITLAGSVGLVCREMLTQLKDTTLLTMWEMLGMMHLTSAVKFNEVKSIMYFPNGSKIFFRDLTYAPRDPEYDRLGSLAITDLFVDEAQQISEKAISVLKGRFSLLNGKNPDGTRWHTIPKALYTCNPKRNWIYNDFVKPDKEGTLPPYRKFIKALPVDNPYVDKAYIDNLLKADKVTVQRLYFGNFEYDDDPAVLCDYDAINDLFVNDHVKPVGSHSGAADIAGKGHDRFVAGSWVGNVCYIKEDMEYSPGKEVENRLKQMMIDDSIPRSLMIVDADGIGSFLESYLEGIKEFHANGRPLDSRYDNLKSECAFKLAELINKRAIKIVCTAEQRERIMDKLGALKQADNDHDTKKFGIIKKEAMKIILGHSPDYLDMLIMSMYFRRVKASRGPQMRVQTHSNK